MLRSNRICSYTALAGLIDHNLLLNYDADEHIDWTNATENFLTVGSITGNSLIIDSIGINDNRIVSAPGWINFVDDDLTTTGDLTVTNIACNDHIYMTPQNDTVVAINIQGETQDYTGLALGETIQAQRDIAIVTLGGNVPDYIGIRNEVSIKHVEGRLHANTYYWGDNAIVRNIAGLLENVSGTFDRTLQECGYMANISDEAAYDTTTIRKINIVSKGLETYQSINPEIIDTGGTTPANTLTITGLNVRFDSAPTITSGVLALTSYGLYIDTDVTDMAGLTSTSYGIYINDVSGADTLYSVYDASGEAWELGTSNLTTTGIITGGRLLAGGVQP